MLAAPITVPKLELDLPIWGNCGFEFAISLVGVISGVEVPLLIGEAGALWILENEY